MKSNNLVDQKLVIAHVYAHCDFFKNNYWFSKTNRKMIDEIANHASRIRVYQDRYGVETVEDFIDVCLSIDNLIDIQNLGINPDDRRRDGDVIGREGKGMDEGIHKLKSKGYMDSFINTKEFLDYQRKKLEEKKKKQGRIPEEPERDVLLFLLKYAPLTGWQRDILSIVREEAYYFAPQGQTKIMNEGWASYWHSFTMTRRCLDDSEIVDFADHHSGTMATAPRRLNPYKLGLELYRDIEDRWNKGRFGLEYEQCDDMNEKLNWNRKLGLGREKIFQVRQFYNDVMFIDEFLTEEFCRERKLFVFATNPRTGKREILTRAFKAVKEQILFSLTNFGEPVILVKDGNFKNKNELLLYHKHAGADLKVSEARETMINIERIWKRPVALETVLEGKATLLRWDG
jgi:stage V sporulation protein R